MSAYHFALRLDNPHQPVEEMVTADRNVSEVDSGR